MNESCTVYKTMSYLSKKWAVLIILELYKGEEWKRFSAIKRSMREITPKMLSERLANLEEEGIVEKRVQENRFPMKSEYRLTPMGHELVDVIKGVKEWALKWKVHNPDCASQNCAVCPI